jgi:hypothetical protein
MIHCITILFGYRKFTDEYVNKLFRGIKANTSKEFLFTCFTDRYGTNHTIQEGIEVRPLPIETGDWYSKIGLYNEELYNPNDQIFYFDLDTAIVGNLDDIFNYSGNFAILRDFYRKNGYGSGFMSWRPPAVHHMYQNYRGQKCRQGDQGWPEQQYPGADIWQDMYPNQVASYKVHYRDRNRGGIRGEAIDTNNVRVVCFHGRPFLHEISQYWNLYE